MTKKGQTMRKLTKQQREAKLVAAVEMRLKDILCGAYGPYNCATLVSVFENEMAPSSLGVDVLSRWIGGACNAFDGNDSMAYPWNINALESWDKPLDEVAEWLCGFDVVRNAMKGRVL